MKKIASIILLLILLTSTYPYALLTPKVSSSNMHKSNASNLNSALSKVSNGFKPMDLEAIRNRIYPDRMGLPLELVFKEPIFVKDPILGRYYIPLIPGTQLEISENSPVIPVNVTVIKLPYSADEIRVELVSMEEKTIRNDLYIMPSPKALLLWERNKTSIENVLSSAINTNYPYPENPISYRVLRGIDPVDMNRYSYLVIKFYPLRIISNNELEFVKRAKIRITYHMRSGFSLKASAYSDLDAVIITNNKLYDEAMKLARFKNDTGIKTIVMTVEKINSTFTGRDLQERIRNYIKSIVSTHGVKFVILFGDSEIIPPRYVWVPDGAYDSDDSIDGSVVETDLYYADLDYSWDSNNDGLWGDLDHDQVDGLPDIFVGRIPVSNITDAEAYISKELNYDPTTNWFNSTLMIGTDTFGMGAPEGEYLTHYIEQFIPKNYTVVKLLETVGNLTLLSMINEINQGYGYINYAGHGDIDRMIIGMGEAYTMDLALRQINKNRPSIIFSMACLTARFANLDGIGESFVINPNGGAIAYVGSTRLAWGYIGDLVVSGLAGEMDWRFAKALFSGRFDYIGQVWADMISGYIQAHPIKTSLGGYYIDWKTVTEFVLLGDPTLSIRAIKTSNKTRINLSDMSGLRELRIENSTVELTGYYHGSSASILIENSTVIMKNASIVLDGSSSLKVLNSHIIGNGNLIINEESSIKANLSVINGPEVVMNRSELILNESSLSSVFLVNNESKIAIYNSTSQLILYLENKVFELELSNGYYIEENLISEIGYDIYLERSYVGFSIKAFNATINLTDSKLYQVTLNKSKLELMNTIINDIALITNSSVKANNSVIGLEIDLRGIKGDLKNLTTQLTNFILSNMNISGFNSLIEGKNTTISHINLNISDSSISINESLLSSIRMKNSLINITNSYLVYVSSFNSSLRMMDTEVLYLIIENNSSLINESSVKYIETINSSLEVTRSHVVEARLFTSGSNISHVLCYYIYAFGKTNITINSSRILSIIAMDNSNITVTSTRFALMYARDQSEISLINVTNTFGIRLFDLSRVHAFNSTIWPELILINESYTVSDLSFGYIEKQSISNGWSLIIDESYVLGWDVLAYSSNVTVIKSSIFWLFAFYETRISVINSDIGFLRLTDNSTARVKLSSISQVIASQFSEAYLYKTMIGVAIGLGSSKITIASSIINQVVGFMNSSIDIEDVIGGIVAPLDSSKITIKRSKCSLWLEIYDKEFSKPLSFVNKFYDTLSSSDLGLGSTAWSLNVESALISWVLVFTNSSVTLKDSFLYILEGIQSEIDIMNTKIINFMGYYQSNISMSNVVSANITVIISSNAEISDSSFGLLSLYHSKVNLSSTISMISIILDNGESNLHLYTGIFNDKALSDFGSISDDSLEVRFDNTSVLGWYVLTLGKAKLELSRSNLISVGAFENSQITITKSFMYGYLEIFDNAEMKVSDSIIHYLYLSIFNHDLTISKVKEQIDYLNIKAGFSLELLNVKVSGIDIDAYLTKLAIVDTSIMHRVSVSNGVVYLAGAKISNLKALLSIITISDSKIGELKASSSGVIISNSVIGNIIPLTHSEILAKNSNIGVTITMYRDNGEYRSLKPIEDYSGEINGENWNIELIETSITKYMFMIQGFSNVTIRDSRVSKIAVKQFASLAIVNTTSNSIMVTDESRIVSRSSTIGLDLRYFMDIFQLNISEGYYREASITGHNAFRFDITFISTRVTSINITMVASTASIINSKLTFIIIDYASECSITNSYILYMLLGLGSSIISTHSELRIIVPFQSNRLFLSSVKIGLTKVVFNSNASIKLPSGDYDEWKYSDNHLGWSLTMIGSTLYDWRIMAISKSLVNVTDTHVLVAYADGESRLFVKDCLLEMPPVADDYAEIQVLWSLKVHVVRDFQSIKNAKIEILNSNGTLVSQAYSDENGSAIFILPQAIVTRDKRIDLGHYKIIASYEFSKASQDIYLWHEMEVQIYLMGYLTIIGVSAVIVALGYVIYLLVRKKLGKGKSAQSSPGPMDFSF